MTMRCPGFSARAGRVGGALFFWGAAATGLWAQGEPEHGGVPGAGPQPRVNGFADVRYVATDTTGSRNGFALGQLDLYVRSLLSDRMGVFSEIVIHPGSRNQFRVVLERLLVTYSPSDHLRASVGRFHTAIGYYNATYHHGTWLQTATGRPLIAAFEGDGGVLPIHTVGISLGGLIAAPLGLRYVAEVGNGRASQASVPARPQPTLAENNTPAVNVGLRIRPERWRALEIGASLYVDRVTPDTLPARQERILAGFIVYHTEVVEILAEAVAMRHQARGAASTAIDGGYVQASRAFGLVRPYVRYDVVNADAADPLFGHLGRRRGPTAGVRVEVDEFAAVKIQASRLERSVGPSIGRLEAQVAFTF